ncbi:MAG: hypothetical protein KY442_03070 [Proteobacteria bacterium]|nr:hypothetical protein [Pseudomonadota bacterium]
MDLVAILLEHVGDASRVIGGDAVVVPVACVRTFAWTTAALTGTGVGAGMTAEAVIKEPGQVAAPLMLMLAAVLVAERCRFIAEHRIAVAPRILVAATRLVAGELAERCLGVEVAVTLHGGLLSVSGVAGADRLDATGIQDRTRKSRASD